MSHGRRKNRGHAGNQYVPSPKIAAKKITAGATKLKRLEAELREAQQQQEQVQEPEQ